MSFRIRFDFVGPAVEGTPPRVLIYRDKQKMGEVFETPKCKHPSGWSPRPADWEPEALAKRTLAYFNAVLRPSTPASPPVG